MELGREPGCDKLRQFLMWIFGAISRTSARIGGGAACRQLQNQCERGICRSFGQYLLERGYFTVGESPALFRDVSGNGPQRCCSRIQRLWRAKWECRTTTPVPASLAFLADETTMDKSFEKFSRHGSLPRQAQAMEGGQEAEA